MKLGENLQFLRRRREMTQEDLAEYLGVSRQSVSRWESNAAYPEMETMLRLCDLFGCDMDTLLRGDVSRRFGEDAAAYDRHMNAFARAIAAGVALVLLGVTLMAASAALPLPDVMAGVSGGEALGVILFFLCLTAAVVLFIVFGMRHSAFCNRWGDKVPCYTPEQLARFGHRFPLLIAVPVAIILLGVLATVVLALCPPPARLAQEWWEAMCAVVLLLCVTVAVPTLTWAGLQRSKYRIPRPEETPEQRRAGRVWGAGMLAATAVYVGLGLCLDLWDRAWVVYPVVALLCAAVTVLLKRDRE